MACSESTIVVRYAETDQMGVVHHAVYPVWYEVARTDCIKKIGITYAELERMGVMTPVVDLNCHYSGSAYYGEECVVRVSISLLTAARIRFDYEITRPGEQKPFHTGSTLHGWVDTKTFRPVNMKRRFPDLYAKMEAFVEPRAE
ncbi:MAG: acyl-CoA thioesterase [Oscillospiraceae bacterium]